MSLVRSIRWQVGLLVLLFTASVAALLFNTFSTLALPQRELEIRADLTRTSAQMADGAATLADGASSSVARPDLDQQLRQIASDAMAPLVGVEGGFYLPRSDEFVGYAFPSDVHRPGKKPRRNDPPPMEEPYIRVQSRQSLSLADDEVLANVRDVGPSRVLVVTRPVGRERPATMAVWTMYRLTGPAELEHQLNRYRLSIFLALSGIALALVLTVRLAQSSERQRRQTERLQDDLRRSEHLASLGTMLAGVAHEVRNPLAGIRSTAQLWLRLGAAAYTTESIQAVIQSVDRLNDIVSRLLLFARADSSDRQPVEVNVVLAEVVKFCADAAKVRGVELWTKLEGVPITQASAGGLHQVFLNLITNALDALPPGGHIEITSRVDARVGHVEIRIADHLFEPFFTTRPEGTGLGLAICREIVMQHGGQIRLENDSGPGATFLVSLPIAYSTLDSLQIAMTNPLRAPVIWIADDETLIRSNLRKLLESEGYRVREAGDGLAAEEVFVDPEAGLLLLDLKMPRQSGLELLRKHHDHLEELPVIVITALGGSAAAIEAMKLGAFDYITKPFELDEVLLTVRRALKQRSLAAQVELLTAHSNIRDEVLDDEMIGRSAVMLEVFKTIGKVAMTSEPVLILGESGTGKELVASAIHRNSQRSAAQFVRVNCAALSPTLLESELFGHQRGAFTGAVATRIGRFEQADGGSLFLDEIGDLDFELQAKLLRVVQFGQFERVGSNATVRSDVRVIAATHRDPAELVRQGKFREDLLYRLNVLTIALPPLRQRPEDIPPLAEHVLERMAAKYNWPRLALSPDAVQQLVRLPWPGNVRQLQNTLARAAILARGHVICPEHLQLSEATQASAPGTTPTLQSGMSLREILAQIEQRLIEEALTQTGWNRSQAARLLGISRRVLFDKIQQFGLSR